MTSIDYRALDTAVGEHFDTLRRRVADRLAAPERLAWLFRVPPVGPWAPDYLTFGAIGRNGVERFLNTAVSGLAPRLWHATLWAKIRTRVMDYGATTYFPKVLKDVPKTPEIEALRRATLEAMNGLLLRDWPELRACTFYEAFDCLAAIMNEARRLAGYEVDAFAPDRARQNAASLAALPAAAALVGESDDALGTLLRLCCRSNWIDGMEDGVEAVHDDIIAEIEGAAKAKPSWLVRDDGPTFEIDRCRAVLSGPPRHILYDLDNCGEAVFDLLLVEALLRRGHRVTLSVKEQPVANDVTRTEMAGLLAAAPFAGLREARDDGRLGVVTAGAFAAARLLNAASEEYRRAYAAGDLVLLKGQGNFQTMPLGRRQGGRFVPYPYARPVMVLMGVKADLARLALATIYAAPPALGEPYVVYFDPADPRTYPA
jgi:uncharacterized protein with ATP-grasp and redox domains